MANGLISQFNPKPSFLTRPTHQSLRPSTRYGPNITAMDQNQSYWASIESDVQTYLQRAITIRPPESVFEPMHQLTFAAPRTTASALCVAACELFGGDRSQAMAAASAVHLIHAAAWIHEHIPLTDRPKPRPSIEHKFGPNIELLTGDGIIPFGLELLAKPMGPEQAQNPDKILRVIMEISRAAGSQGVVDGQFHELGVDELGNDYEIIEYVAKKKEGELHACGAACGAILGGGAEEEVEKLRKFGMYLGMVKFILGRKKPGMEENLERLKGLAVKELESFQGKKIELISRLVELEPSLETA
uniref:Geranyl diphosphate synthase small subunit n=1 Tax=Picrorhiza kurrooa TaxID=195120 RepID=A0A1V0JFK5_9LAMI|nr:geranyl diphosphate synthase small subunit [Picrorhiza kurrooa]